MNTKCSCGFAKESIEAYFKFWCIIILDSFSGLILKVKVLE